MSTKDELRQVEEDLERLRAENREIREQIRDMGATDQMEKAAVISQADEQVELIAGLERRRDWLIQRLKEGKERAGGSSP
jgi:predicted HAD superfamily hydrolase